MPETGPRLQMVVTPFDSIKRVVAPGKATTHTNCYELEIQLDHSQSSSAIERNKTSSGKGHPDLQRMPCICLSMSIPPPFVRVSGNMIGSNLHWWPVPLWPLLHSGGSRW